MNLDPPQVPLHLTTVLTPYQDKILGCEFGPESLFAWLELPTRERDRRSWIILPDKSVIAIAGHLRFADAQTIVDGYVELVRLPRIKGLQMYVNEEGRLKQLDFNPIASLMARTPVVGTVILTNLTPGGPPHE